MQVAASSPFILYAAYAQRPEIISSILEDRDDDGYEKAKKMGLTTICGHTPSGDGKIVQGDRIY